MPSIFQYPSSQIRVLAVQHSIEHSKWGVGPVKSVQCVFGNVSFAQACVSPLYNLSQLVRNFLRVICLFFINLDIVSLVCIQLIIIDSLDFHMSVKLVILQLVIFVVYDCTTAMVSVMDLSLPFRLILEWLNAAWSKWTMTSPKSILTLIAIPLGKVVGFLTKFCTSYRRWYVQQSTYSP